MRKLLAGLLLVTLSTSCFGATIKFFTDYPNSVPSGSDFFVLQRNQGYVNATAAQVKSDWFNNPVFTGNGGIQGVWTAVTFVGDGSQLTGIASSGNVTNTAVYFAGLNTNFTLLIGANGTNYVNQISNALYQIISAGPYVANFNGNGTNTTNWGVSTFQEIDAANFYPTNMFTGLTNVLLGTDSDGKIIATNVTSGTTYSNLTESAFAMLIRSNLVTKGYIMESNSLGSVTLSNATVTLVGGASEPATITGKDGGGNTSISFDGTNFTVTSLTIRYNTNSIPSTGALTFGRAYFTNLQASVVLPAFTINDSYYETLVICVTNSTGSTTTLTMPSGVKVAVANGGGNLIYCTNGTRTTVVVEHYGNILTNAWKNDF